MILESVAQIAAGVTYEKLSEKSNNCYLAAYEKYKWDWCLSHLTVKDVLSTYTDYENMLIDIWGEPTEENRQDYPFDEYLEEYGFGGALYMT